MGPAGHAVSTGLWHQVQPTSIDHVMGFRREAAMQADVGARTEQIVQLGMKGGGRCDVHAFGEVGVIRVHLHAQGHGHGSHAAGDATVADQTEPLA